MVHTYVPSILSYSINILLKHQSNKWTVLKGALRWSQTGQSRILCGPARALILPTQGCQIAHYVPRFSLQNSDSCSVYLPLAQTLYLYSITGGLLWELTRFGREKMALAYFSTSKCKRKYKHRNVRKCWRLDEGHKVPVRNAGPCEQADRLGAGSNRHLPNSPGMQAAVEAELRILQAQDLPVGPRKQRTNLSLK